MNLAAYWPSHERIIKAGGVTGLLYPLQSGSPEVQSLAAGALMNLSENSTTIPRLTLAASSLMGIFVKSKDKELRGQASVAVRNLVNHTAAKYTESYWGEREPERKDATETSDLRSESFPIPNTEEKGSMGIAGWM